jgi:hypothetical protein
VKNTSPAAPRPLERQRRRDTQDVTGVYSGIFRVPAAEQQRLYRVADSKALRVLVTHDLMLEPCRG